MRIMRFMRILTNESLDLLLERKLTKEDRDKLDSSLFGIPETRSYPMPDVEHVIYAVRMFNFCRLKDEEKLAENIIKRILHYINVGQLNIESIRPGGHNRFKQYWDSYLNSRTL